MNLLTISSELRQLLVLADEWKNSSQIPEIEREIALDKLKLIYSHLKNITPLSVSPLSAVRESKPTAFAASNTSLQGVFFDIQEDNHSKLEPIPSIKKQPSSHVEELVIPDFPLLNTRSKEGDELPRLTLEEASPILESISSLVNAINCSAKSAELKVEPKKDATIANTQEVLDVKVPCSNVVIPSVEEVVKPHHTKIENHRLGDVFEGKHAFLNETISPNRQPDLSSKLQHQHITDLNKAISFNDKFLLVKELFKGDIQAYEKTIVTLNGFESLDQALIYIHENHSWDTSSDAANQLVELLQRKFS
jgi:hypothetical protein